MFGFAGVVDPAGPLFYSEETMGQAPSATVERDDSRKASTPILREHSIQQTAQESRTSSPWSMHFARTDQRPYRTSIDDDMANTPTNLPRLPKDIKSAELIWFLRNTAPPALHRQPSKIEHPKRGGETSRRALRLLRLGQRRNGTPKDLPPLRDEGGLLTKKAAQVVELKAGIPAEIQHVLEQKQTAAGQRYLALKVKQPDFAPVIEAGIVDSHVSVSFEHDLYGGEPPENRFECRGSQPAHSVSPLSPLEPLPIFGISDSTVRCVDHSLSPVRPAASSPPTPQPDSATSMAESYQCDLTEHPARRSFDACRALTSHPVRPEPSITALPKIALPKEELPVRHASAEKEVEIKHPSPRRFASHPVLMQRAPSMASSFYPQSMSDSPGPPPPRSPLRLRRDQRTIENIIATHNSVHARKATPRHGRSPMLTPTSERIMEYNERLAAMKPTVITECTGPIKRPNSRGKSSIPHPAYQLSRKEREERIKARRLLRDQHKYPIIEPTVSVPQTSTLPRRLRKARPRIQIPHSDLRPAPLVLRAPSSSASSDAGWMKTNAQMSPRVSPVSSQETGQASNGEKTGYTPVSPLSTGSATVEACMALSPVMLVAEEIPVFMTKSLPRPPKLIVKEGKSYAPRPRSASIPRNAFNRRSRQGQTSPPVNHLSRPGSPAAERPEDETPPLPSPPPNRALPPTPPASGSEKPVKFRAVESKKELPIPPPFEILPLPQEPLPIRRELRHVVTQNQRKSGVSSTTSKSASRIDARLEALEKRNALLSAALMAVLGTNGSLNAPLSAALTAEPESPKAMVWESRVARRSEAGNQAASHAASSSNGSALEMYMSTRRGSKTGC
ncbi:hypothetical protein BAUCODRAFT_149913 [Baudoinia panamericana UAMH 10762]|uniref:Uncharacterized protein n=1 Tax=Baudoinia panamericana (strain UAMH 10762) TaxID=717646 RepID=M2N7P4_BAUPA|nr:uncharacterized protein BAUCODRAFT_149913 [Baudoinia panamericana UAMH 10762]EMC94825.1 hypothetical protein BAUCODRAFT_149913 [Baudoinia panamericana UAMH 10762]